MNRPALIAERLIFGSRYLLVVFYLTCVAGLAAYVGDSCWQAIKFCAHIAEGGQEDHVIGILGLLDAMMVASAIFLIVAGSYLVYVKPRLHDKTMATPDKRPQALQHLSPGTLKEKMAASLIGVSSVNLLTVLLQSANQVNGEVARITTHQLIVYLSYVGVKVVVHGILIYGFVQFYKSNAAEEAAEAVNHEEVHHAEAA